MSLMGPDGLARVATACHDNTRRLRERLAQLQGVEVLGGDACFHELVFRVQRPAQEVLAAMAEQGVLAGYGLEQDYPELTNCILACATETKTQQDLDRYVSLLADVLNPAEVSPC